MPGGRNSVFILHPGVMGILRSAAWHFAGFVVRLLFVRSVLTTLNPIPLRLLL